MLIPKRVKRRKQHRGNIKGQAHKGNKVAYGEYGLVAVEGRTQIAHQDEIHGQRSGKSRNGRTAGRRRKNYRRR